MSVTMTIPGLPPTANDRLGAHVVNGKAKLHRTKGASSWQSTVSAYGRIAMGRAKLIAHRVAVRLVFRVGPRRRRDVDAGVKDTLDGLTGAVLTDDRLVRSLTVELEDVGSDGDEATVIEVDEQWAMRGVMIVSNPGEPMDEPIPYVLTPKGAKRVSFDT